MHILKKVSEKLLVILMIVAAIFMYLLLIPANVYALEKDLSLNNNIYKYKDISKDKNSDTYKNNYSDKDNYEIDLAINHDKNVYRLATGGEYDINKNPNANKEDRTEISPEDRKDIAANGETNENFKSKNRSKSIILSTLVGTVLSLVILFFGYPILIVGTLLIYLGAISVTPEYSAAYEKGLAEYDNKNGVSEANSLSNKLAVAFLTLDKIFFGDVKILNINMYKKLDPNGSHGADKFREGVANGVITSIYIAVTLTFLIMLFGAILLMYRSLKLKASGKDKAAGLAQTKLFMVNVVKGLLIALFINVMLAFIVYTHDMILAVLNVLRLKLVESGSVNVEHVIIKKVLDLELSSGIDYAVRLLSYMFLIVYNVKFLIIFANRMLTISFLTIISPIISVTYSLDKVGDGKSQILNNFIKEYVDVVLIGIIYPLIYLVFMTVLGPAAQNSPIFGLIVIASFSKFERMFKKVFDLRGLATVRSSKGGLSFN